MTRLEHFEEQSNHVAAWGGRLVTAVFCLLGIGILLPWNAFISAKPYFQSRLCKDGKEAENVELLFGLVFNISSVAALGLILLVQYIQDQRQLRRRQLQGIALPTSDDDSKDLPGVVAPTQEDPLVDHEGSDSGLSHSFFTVILPLFVYLVVFIWTTALVLMPNVSGSAFFTRTLIGLALCGMSCAIAGSGVVATAGKFAHKVGINAYFSGQAIGGVAVSFANLMAATLEDPNKFRKEQCKSDDGRLLVEEQDGASCLAYEQVDWSTFVYFSVGCAVLGACVLGYLFIERSDIAAQLEEQENIRRTLLQNTDTEPNDMTASLRLGIELQEHQTTPGDDVKPADADRVSAPLDHSPYQDNAVLEEADENQNDGADAIMRIDETDEEYTTLHVLKAVSGPALAIWLTFFVTLAIFPSWTSRLESAHKCHSHLRLYNDLFLPITFVIYNTGDLTGRVLAAKVKVEAISSLSKKLILAAFVRFLFGPLFLVCLATGSVFNAIAIHLDIVSVTVQFLFAVTNGLIVSVAFMHAPTLIPSTQSVQETSATLLNFSLVFGLLCGSFFSFTFSQIGTGEL